MGVRIGTWNVQYGVGAEKNRRRRALLDERDADVWVLTETNDQLDLSHAYEPVRSRHRYLPSTGGRWVTIWTRLPILSDQRTEDLQRTVAVHLDGGRQGPLCVFGTVLPWQHDKGPDPLVPAAGWTEFYRTTPPQSAEWCALRQSHPSSTLIVAGDLNQNLGGPHYYGTNLGRAMLREGLSSASLECLTETEKFGPGVLTNPPIDHICVSPPSEHRVDATIEGWNNIASDGYVLSDHSGVLADVRIS
jgi:endonuclease/exonuclease/phosphatase family metal-dependent hydrolase